MGSIRITSHSLIRDDVQGDAFQSEVTKVVDGDMTKVRIAVPGGVVPPVEMVDRTSEVARHELRQYVAMRNLQAQLQAMPEARRRREDRKQRLRLERTRERCTGCGGSGWVEDHELNQSPCPECSG